MNKFFPALMAGLLALTMTACGSSQADPTTLATGGNSGVYASYGKALTQVLEGETDLPLQAKNTEGSMENLQGIRSGDYDLGLVQSDVMTYAWQGRRAFEQLGRTDSFQVIAGLYTEAVQLITLDPEIEEADDLAGRTVSVGTEKSGTFFNAFDVIDSAGLTMSDITPVYLDFAQSMEALKNGEIDAAFVVAGSPTPAVTELFRSGEAYVVPIKHFIHKRLLEDCPFYVDWVIPAGSYAGQDQDVQTVGVTAMLVASADASAEDIYELTGALFEKQEELAALHGKGADLTLELATSVRTVPYHPGAIRYYEEHGISLK